MKKSSSLVRRSWSDSARCEGVVAEFERAWDQGETPVLAVHLDRVPECDRPALLLELVHAELEFRLRAGQNARVEDYLALYPDLAGNDALVLGLIEAEREVRENRREAISPEEYPRRFPHFRDALIGKATSLHVRIDSVLDNLDFGESNVPGILPPQPPIDADDVPPPPPKTRPAPPASRSDTSVRPTAKRGRLAILLSLTAGFALGLVLGLVLTSAWFRPAVHAAEEAQQERIRAEEHTTRARQQQEVVEATLRQTRTLLVEKAQADNIFSLAEQLQAGKQTQEAEKAYRQAVALHEKVYARSAGLPGLRWSLVRGWYRVAILDRNAGRLADAEKTYRQVVEMLKTPPAESPLTVQEQGLLGAALNNLAVLVRERGQAGESRTLYDEAIARQKIALAASPRHPTYRQSLRNHYWGLAETLLLLGDHKGAAHAAVELPRLQPERWEEYHRSAGLLARCIPVTAKDGALTVSQQQALARSYQDQAIGFLRQAVQKGFSHGDLLKNADYQPLRSSVEFRALLAEVTKSRLSSSSGVEPSGGGGK